MDATFSLIVAETESGRPLNLYNEAQCATAVANGDIAADSPIVVYVDGTGTSMRAIDHPAFASLAPAAPPPPASPASPPPPSPSLPPPPPPIEEEPQAAFDDRDVRPIAPPDMPTVPPVEPARTLVVVPPPPPPPGRGYQPAGPPSAVVVRNALLGLCGLLLLAFCTTRNTSRPAADIGGNGQVSENMTATETDPEANLPEVTRYTLRDVNAQTGATSGTSQDKIERGAEVSGVIVPGSVDATQRWMKLRSGRYEGRYIWAANLAETAPPALDTGFAGTKMAFMAGTIRTAPASDAAEINEPTFPIGRSFLIAGKVNGDWAELLLKHGGVGYVEAAVFEPPAAANVGTTHSILVANECLTSSFTFALYYQDAFGWHNNNGALWIFQPGVSLYPTFNDNHLITTNPTIYYAITAVNGRAQNFTGSNSVQYGTTMLSMRQAVVTYMDNGDYKITLQC
jgi:hypothetical protein